MDNLLAGPDWTSLGLGGLHIIIEGTPRATKEQEQLLNQMQQEGRSKIETAEEKEAIEQEHMSYRAKRQVYQRLGRLEELNVIDFALESFPRERRNRD